MNASNTDFLCCSCKSFEEHEAPKMFFKSEQCLHTGMPRNDLFFKDNKAAKKKVYDYLGLSENDKLVLFAPTYRSNTESFANKKVSREIDIDYKGTIEALQARFGGDWKFGIRLHPRIGTSEFEDPTIVNCTKYPDMQELLHACNVVITDYSSLMWDFSLTKKPCLIYAPDIEEYERDRGFYTPVSAWPFPVAKSNEELIANIEGFNESEYHDKVAQHHRALGSFEDGNASKKVIDLVIRGKNV